MAGQGNDTSNAGNISSLDHTFSRHLDLIHEELDLYFIMSVLMTSSGLLLSTFLLLQILRSHKRRETLVNQFIMLSCGVNVVSLSYPILLATVANVRVFCAAACLAFPTVMLMQKMLNTAVAFVRYCHVFHQSMFTPSSHLAILFAISASVAIVSLLPLCSITMESMPLHRACLGDPDPGDAQKLVFRYIFFVVIATSSLLDAIFYVRILNFMRKSGARVMVVPSSTADRNLIHNVVTAPSSFVVWMVSLVGMMPASSLFLQSPYSASFSRFITLVRFELAALAVLAVFVPIIYVGSSADLRNEVIRIRDVLTDSLLRDTDPDLDDTTRGEIYVVDR